MKCKSLPSSLWLRYAVFAGILLVTLFFPAGCSPVRKLNTLNLASRYAKPAGLGVRTAVFNLNDSISRVYVRINSPVQKVSGRDNEGYLKIRYAVYSSISQGKLIDSATVKIADSSLVQYGFLDHTWDFKAGTGNDYQLLVIVTHSKRNDQPVNVITSVMKQGASSGNWLLLQDSDEVPLFDNYSVVYKPLRIVSSQELYHSVKVSCFFRNFPPAMPPFAFGERPRFDYKVDSVFYLSLKQGVSDYFTLTKKGIYLFSLDTAGFNGFGLAAFDPGFPKISTPRQMIESARYITTAAEYEKLTHSQSYKAAIDSFWIANSGNADRASVMIRNYYTRVEDANRFFSSFTEGWKTDRGMIFIIFGPPDYLYRSDAQEQWIYGEPGNIRSMKFYFDKVINPFSGDDYLLQRSEMFKTLWYNAVQLWRR